MELENLTPFDGSTASTVGTIIKILLRTTRYEPATRAFNMMMFPPNTARIAQFNSILGLSPQRGMIGMTGNTLLAQPNDGDHS